MGGCFSAVWNDSVDAPAAYIVTPDGELRQHMVPVTASRALAFESAASSCFLCDSDSLYYDDPIPALEPDHELSAKQIYFVLPAAKLHQRLSASDMAALAVKANQALQRSSGATSSLQRKARISPVVQLDQTVKESASYSEETVVNEKYNNNKSSRKPSAPACSRPTSLRKQQRFSSKRAKLAVRSFRHRLSTIDEGSARLCSDC